MPRAFHHLNRDMCVSSVGGRVAIRELPNIYSNVEIRISIGIMPRLAGTLALPIETSIRDWEGERPREPEGI